MSPVSRMRPQMMMGYIAWLGSIGWPLYYIIASIECTICVALILTWHSDIPTKADIEGTSGYRGWFPHVCSECSYIASNLLLFITKEGTSYRVPVCFVCEKNSVKSWKQWAVKFIFMDAWTATFSNIHLPSYWKNKQVELQKIEANRSLGVKYFKFSSPSL